MFFHIRDHLGEIIQFRFDERFQFRNGSENVRDHDGKHACVQGGSEAILRVLEDQRFSGLCSKSGSCLFIYFRIRFGAVDLVTTDDHRKIVPYTTAFQFLLCPLLTG